MYAQSQWSKQKNLTIPFVLHEHTILFLCSQWSEILLVTHLVGLIVLMTNGGLLNYLNGIINNKFSSLDLCIDMRPKSDAFCELRWENFVK